MKRKRYDDTCFPDDHGSCAASKPVKTLHAGRVSTPSRLNESLLVSLPEEIIEQIGTNLNKRDVRSCRKAGNMKIARAMLYSSYFDTLSIMLASPDSLAVALDILQHNVIARRINTVYLNTEQLKPSFEVSTPADVLRHGQVRAKAYQDTYDQLLEQQQKHQRKQRDIQKLSRIFARFQEIGNPIAVVMTSSARCVEHWRCPFYQHSKDSEIGRYNIQNYPRKFCGSYTNDAVHCAKCAELRPYRYRRLTAKIGRPLHSLDSPYDSRYDRKEDALIGLADAGEVQAEDDRHPIAIIFRALLASGLTPGSFSAESYKWDVPFAQFLIPLPVQSDLGKNFTNLRSLRLRLEGPDYVRRQHEVIEVLPRGFEPGAAALGALLKAASASLELLAISQSDDLDVHSEETRARTFKSCIEPQMFPRLRELILGSATMTVDGLRSFLSRHEPTLRRISIPFCTVLLSADSLQTDIAYSVEEKWGHMVGISARAIALRASHGLEFERLRWDVDEDVNALM